MSSPRLLERARRMRHRPTEAEHRLWLLLRSRRLEGYKFRRQVWIGHFIVDFLCLEARLVVEVDGGQHASERAYDSMRSTYLQSRGLRVGRFWSNEVLQHPEAVIERLCRELARRDR